MEAVTAQLANEASLLGRGTGSFRISTQVEVKLFRAVSSKSPPRKDIATNELLGSLRAVFEIAYTVPEGLKMTDQDFEQFARINGTHNAWPYC